MDYSALTPADLAILCFKTSDEPAWAEFVRRFHPLIARVAIRVAHEWGEASTQTIDDLIQDTYLKLYQNRGNFAATFKPVHPDAIFGYIKVFTANLIHDRFKASHSQKRGCELTTSLETADESTLSKTKWARRSSADLDRIVLIGQIESCLQSITSGDGGRRDRQIFWLYYRAGLSARAIASLPKIGLTTKGVESTLVRLARQVREQLGQSPQLSSEFRNAEKGKQSAESL